MNLFNGKLRLIIIVLLAAGLIVCFSGTDSVDEQAHVRMLQTLKTLQFLDSGLNQALLASRQAYLSNYDPTVIDLKGLGEKGRELKPFPKFLSTATRRILEQRCSRWESVLKEKEELSEDFKSRNAILRNSTRLLPLSAAEIAAALQGEHPELAEQVRTLSRSLLLYSLYPDRDFQRQIERRIQTLKSAEMPHLLETRQKMMAAHATRILEERKALDELTVRLLNLPTGEVLQEMYSIYMGDYTRALVRAGRFRAAGKLFSTLLLLLMVQIVLREYEDKEELAALKVEVEQTSLYHRQEMEAKEQQLIEKSEDLQLIQSRLEVMAVSDEKTGLYTRRFLYEWLGKQLSALARTGGSCCCLVVDVDRLKRINSQFGGKQGDLVLIRVARLLQECVRKDDVVGRYGGEEFVILLSGMNLQRVKPVAERICRKVAEELTEPCPITVSIGVSGIICNQEICERMRLDGVISTLLERSHSALRQAKEEGRNQVALCSDLVHLRAKENGDATQSSFISAV